MSHSNQPIRILLVHPEAATLAILRSMLQSLGQPLEEAETDRAAMKHLERGTVDLVIAGVRPADPEALELLQYARRKVPKVPVILLFQEASPEKAKEALQRGAAAILRFPVAATQIRAAVAQAIGVTESALTIRPSSRPANGSDAPHHQAEGLNYGNGHGNGNGNGFGNGHVNGYANGHNGHAPYNTNAQGVLSYGPARPAAVHGRQADHAFFADGGRPANGFPTFPAAEPARLDDRPTMIGEDPSLRQAIELADSIAPTRAPVLIMGERGSGKALLARALHQRSLRRDGPFVEVTCGHLKESALEIELFGRKGAASDPLGDRPGKINAAAGGTLYLDEVTALSPELQFKLLRLIQEGSYEPAGSTQTFRADVRVILGSKENLGAWVEQGRFRQDLHGRIAVVSLKLPPLRHRGDDVERLAEHVRERSAVELAKEVVGFTAEALAALRRHEWPGNVEELEHAVERAVVLCRGPRIDAEAVARALSDASGPRTNGAHRPHIATRSIRPLKEALEEPEKRIILQALEMLNWNRQETAKSLDINRTTLYKKMKKYGLLLDEPAYLN